MDVDLSCTQAGMRTFFDECCMPFLQIFSEEIQLTPRCNKPFHRLDSFDSIAEKVAGPSGLCPFVEFALAVAGKITLKR